MNGQQSRRQAGASRRPPFFLRLLRSTCPGPAAAPAAAGNLWRNHKEDRMPMFMCLLNWTDQGIRAVKEAPKRAKAAQELAKKVGVEIKEVYLTSGDSDLLVILDTPNGDNVAKFALALGAQGNVRSRTARIWPQAEFQKMISELP
jgi:uncharacterized protein with GYD domain